MKRRPSHIRAYTQADLPPCAYPFRSLRDGEISDEEVCQAIRSVPTHYTLATLQQTDTSSGANTASAACSGASPSISFTEYLADPTGSAGSATHTLATFGNIKGNPSDQRIIHFYSPNTFPNLTSWPSGNYVVRLNITTGNAQLQWKATYVCRVNSSFVNQATIGSLTAQTTSLTGTGVVSHTISGSADAGASATDRVYIVCVFHTASGATQNISFKTDQLIDTPFTASVSDPFPAGYRQNQQRSRVYSLPPIEDAALRQYQNSNQTATLFKTGGLVQDVPSTKQPSQTFYPNPTPPNYSEREGRPKLSIQADLLAQQAPPTKQPSQQHYPLLIENYSEREGRPKLSISGPLITQDSPPTKQLNQSFYPWVIFDDVWNREGRPKFSIQGGFLGQDSPLSKQPSQLWYKKGIEDNSLLILRSRWPIPITGPPPSILPVPNSPYYRAYQRFYPAPDLAGNIAPWEEMLRRRNFPLPPAPTFRGLLRQLGRYRIFNEVTLLYELGRGRYRIANAPVWNIYVGTDAWPALVTPTTTSATLPVSVVVSAPVSGLRTFYIVTRYQDLYGLESQNQQPRSITIDSAGNQILPPLPDPLSVRALPLSNGFIRVLAAYPTLGEEEFPADEWYFWIGASPDPLVDSPNHIANVIGKTIASTIGTFTPGDYEVIVALHRTIDNAFSNYISTTVTLPAAPAAPGDLHGGLEPGW